MTNIDKCLADTQIFLRSHFDAKVGVEYYVSPSVTSVWRGKKSCHPITEGEVVLAKANLAASGGGRFRVLHVAEPDDDALLCFCVGAGGHTVFVVPKDESGREAEVIAQNITTRRIVVAPRGMFRRPNFLDALAQFGAKLGARLLRLLGKTVAS